MRTEIENLNGMDTNILNNIEHRMKLLLPVYQQKVKEIQKGIRNINKIKRMRSKNAK